MSKKGAEFGTRTEMYVAVPKDTPETTRRTLAELAKGQKQDEVLEIVRNNNLSLIIVPKLTSKEDNSTRPALPTVFAFGKLRDDAFRNGDVLDFSLRNGGTEVVLLRSKRLVKLTPTKT